ncbi:MAG: alpha-amylase family glycosyl hydrolase [Cellulosilyticaceae bacterium]
MKRGSVKWLVGIGILCLGVLGLYSVLQKEDPLQDDKYDNYYEIFVYSFCDSDGDGIGDLDGVTRQLDYLKSLGITGIWLTPIMPSPDYHKYSVMDYKGIDPQFGTMADFERLIDEAHKRGIKVIMDLVVNHSSDQNPWFIQAKESLKQGIEGPYVDYYKIHKGTKPEDPLYKVLGIGDYYYEAVFSEYMPDLNMKSEALKEEVRGIAKFWLEKGVDGFRLDAAKYLFAEQKDTIAFWKEFVTYCKQINPEAYIVAEVWSSGGEIEAYYALGIDSFFNFPFAGSNGRLIDAVRLRGGEDFVQGLSKWQARIQKVAPTAIDAIFLTNHDQDRSGGLLGKKVTNQKMAASLYLLAPGNPYVYYGEEIGMLGDAEDPDRRAPMIWSVQQSEGIPQPVPGTSKLTAIESGVAEQLQDDKSLLRFYQELLNIRLAYPEIARGTVYPVIVGGRQVGAYETIYGDQRLLIVHNLSTESKMIHLPQQVMRYKKLVERLVTDEGTVTLRDGVLSMPPQSTALMK